eukprot:1394316-Amorphochlora_amoeboformis.AAC.1
MSVNDTPKSAWNAPNIPTAEKDPHSQPDPSKSCNSTQNPFTVNFYLAKVQNLRHREQHMLQATQGSLVEPAYSRGPLQSEASGQNERASAVSSKLPRIGGTEGPN